MPATRPASTAAAITTTAAVAATMVKATTTSTTSIKTMATPLTINLHRIPHCNTPEGRAITNLLEVI